MPNNKNGARRAAMYVGVVFAGLGLAAAAVATYVTLTVNPVEKTAAEAKEMAVVNEDEIDEINVKIGIVETQTKNIKPMRDELQRFMRRYDVPTIEDVPKGEYPSDKTDGEEATE